MVRRLSCFDGEMRSYIAAKMSLFSLETLSNYYIILFVISECCTAAVTVVGWSVAI